MAKMTLDQLVQQLKAAYGDALDAVVLYGSAARHPGPPTGALDVLVVVRTLEEQALHAAGAATRAWIDAGHPPPLTLTSAEWMSSADIFAIEYADILASHRVLTGALRTEGLVVARHDLRLQLEREVMGKVLQLRRALQAHHGSGSTVRALLESAHGGVFALLRAALRLTDGVAAPHADSATAAQTLAAKVGFDAKPFLALVAHRHGTEKIKDKDAHAVLRGCHDGLQKLAGYLDKLATDDE